MNVSAELKKILSGCYCGVSLSYDENRDKFILFTWGDAPVSIDELAEGNTVFEAVENFKKKHKKR